jgi:type II secretory pathway pseudopilin PulG
VEATLSLGLLSFSLLTLAPLMAIGLKTARHAHDNRDTAQIAQSLIEEAKQGALASGTVYLDNQANPTTASQAAYTAQCTLQTVSNNTALDRWTLRIAPTGAPDRARIYAVVVSAP